MHIAVLAKVVPDYEVPSMDFELSNGRAHERFSRMMGLYDENAIETGIQLKDKTGSSLTLISYGLDSDVQFLRKGVAMGADKLVLVKGTSDDAAVIAQNIKQAVEHLGDVDLILAGQQSADMDRGVVPGILAQMLGAAFVPQVGYIESAADQWKVSQMTATGRRELEFNGLGVLSITSIPENVPRIPAVRAIFGAKKKPVVKLDGIDQGKMALAEISVEIPKIESVCEFIDAEDPNEAVKTLLSRLTEERYI
ncbi:electron transfer flavoprotein beta subunit/FixA family protein [Desulfobacula sp.]|uniref:electron transfer flavoprotein beta subunit/FixA family protein n=1 Tax=Desulfobacula sp. TaxID=2593537 RepID=UPI002607C312|nr:electron transfer flavoprotein beta subunit/FixA family protein [Desulfobacula sp.]